MNLTSINGYTALPYQQKSTNKAVPAVNISAHLPKMNAAAGQTSQHGEQLSVTKWLDFSSQLNADAQYKNRRIPFNPEAFTALKTDRRHFKKPDPDFVLAAAYNDTMNELFEKLKTETSNGNTYSHSDLYDRIMSLSAELNKHAASVDALHNKLLNSGGDIAAVAGGVLYGPIAEGSEELDKYISAQKPEPVSTPQENVPLNYGKNSLAIMESISRNMDLLYNSFFETLPSEKIGFKIEPGLQYWIRSECGELISEGYTEPGREIQEYWQQQRAASSARITTYQDKMRMNAYYMDKIKAVLEENGIKLAPDEKFNISVDKYCNVTVTGNNEQKAKAMEKVLNSQESENWGLLLQRGYMEHNESLFLLPKEHITKVNKMLLENYMANASDGAVSLDDLYLSEDGRIMGLPPELDELINSIEPAYNRMTCLELEKEAGEAYDLAKASGSLAWFFEIYKTDEAQRAFNQGNREEYVRAVVDNQLKDGRYTDVKNVLTEILKIGVNNIPSATTANMVLGNEKIVFG